MSRLYNILNKLCTVEDVTPSSISSFISVNSGYTVSDLSVKRCGKMMTIYFIVARNTESPAGATMHIGTIASAYRPAATSGGASATFRELIGVDGTVYARPATNVGAGSREGYAMTYMLA